MSLAAHLHDGPIHLDYNATAPVDPDVLDAILLYLTIHSGNPSSIHVYGALLPVLAAGHNHQVT